jgi:hypothetical protein
MTIRLIAGIAVVLTAACAAAEVRIEAGWVRAMPPVATTTAGYARLVNTGDQPVAIQAAPVDWAGGAALHEMATADDGTSTMRHLDQVQLAPGATLELAPGGQHLMFTELERVPSAGDRVRVCFRFDAESSCRDFPVRRSAPDE